MSDYFAERAAQWDANPVRAAVGRAIYAEVLRECPDLAGKAVLEFGCGTGTLGLHLALEHGARLTFVDSSPAMMDVLRGKLAEAGLKDAPAHLGELDELIGRAIPEHSMDVLVTGMALHHVADIPAALNAFRRVLKPGGLALAADLLPEDGSFHGAEPVPHNGFEPIELAGQFAAAGLIPGPHREFHTLRKPDAGGAPRDYTLFFLPARAQ